MTGSGLPSPAVAADEAGDRSLTAVWIALDGATVANGCLWMLPRSHRRGVLYPVRDHRDARFDPTAEALAFGQSETDVERVPVEVAAGDAGVFDRYLLHRSLPNRHHGMRRELV